jgi:tetratricopeptide (TPR) repeat protein
MPADSSAAGELLARLCDDLRRLREDAGGPSLRALAAEVGLGKSQIGAILNGRIERLPEWAVVHRLVVSFQRHARNQGRAATLSLRFGIEEYWRQRYSAVEQLLSEPGKPARREQRAAPAQLPATAGWFVGRDAELDQLDMLLAAASNGGVQTLVIAAIGGTAGVGKTSLAVHWSRRVLDRFPDGQLHVNLRGHATSPPVRPEQALARFLRALGVPAEEVPLDVDEAAAMYRTLLADRRMLILLDDAASAEQVRALLPGSPHCLVLVTSRDRLGGLIACDGARLLDLDVLAPGDAHALLAGILGRRRADAESGALAELAGLCGFLPLALRIVAANLVLRPHASVAGYVAELREGNRLTELGIDGDERSTARAAFDLSYASLEFDERRTFRLLGLLPGPDVDVLAAASLTDTSPEKVRRALGRLVDRHLVNEPASGRFALHDLLRLYARSLADAEDGPHETASAIGRLCAFYLSSTAAAARLLYAWTTRLPAQPYPPGHWPAPPFADHAGALKWMDTERANIVALVHQTAEHGPQAAAWQLADNLRGYFYLRRDAGDWLAVATAALRAAEGHPGPQAAAHLSLGVAHATKGNYDAAIANYTTALTLADPAGWLEGQATALNNLGTVYSQTGRHRQAAERFAQTVAVHQRAGNVVGQAVSLDNLGIVCRELGELECAAELHTRAIALYEQTGDPIGHAAAVDNLAAVYHDRGQLDQAFQHYTQAYTLHQQTGDRDRQAICLYGMAEVLCSAGRHDEVPGLAREALDIAREIGDHRTEANATMVLASVDARAGRYRSALDQYRHALHLAVEPGSRYLRARALLGVAHAGLGLEQVNKSLATVREALTLIQDNGYRALEVDCLITLAEIYAAQGRPGEAVVVAREALTLGRQIGYGLRAARTRCAIRQAVQLSRRAAAPSG